MRERWGWSRKEEVGGASDRGRRWASYLLEGGSGRKVSVREERWAGLLLEGGGGWAFYSGRRWAGLLLREEVGCSFRGRRRAGISVRGRGWSELLAGR